MTYAIFCGYCERPASEARPCPEHGAGWIVALTGDGDWEVRDGRWRDFPRTLYPHRDYPAWARKEGYDEPVAA